MYIHFSLAFVLKGCSPGRQKECFFLFSSSRLFLARAFQSCCTFLDATGSHVAIEKRAVKRALCQLRMRYYRDDKL